MSTRPSSSSATPHLSAPPTVPSAIHILASPSPLLIDAALPTYLLPSVISLLTASAAHVVRRRLEVEEEMEDSVGGGEGRGDVAMNGVAYSTKGNRIKGKNKASEEEIAKLVDEQVVKRIESMGRMVGGYVAEKLTLARAPLPSHLDVIKFICKDLFLYVYSKQIDNLRTNHRGVFVLQSHAFPPLANLSSTSTTADLITAKMHLVFPQALIQGALNRLGMTATVSAETSGLPQCTFQIRTIKSGMPATPSSSTPNLAAQAAEAGSARSPNPDSTHVQAQGSAPSLVQHGSAPARTGLGIAGASI